MTVVFPNLPSFKTPGNFFDSFYVINLWINKHYNNYILASHEIIVKKLQLKERLSVDFKREKNIFMNF